MAGACVNIPGAYSAPAPDVNRMLSSKFLASAASPAVKTLQCSTSKLMRSYAIFCLFSSYVWSIVDLASPQTRRLSFHARLKLSCILVLAPWAARAEWQWPAYISVSLRIK